MEKMLYQFWKVTIENQNISDLLTVLVIEFALPPQTIDLCLHTNTILRRYIGIYHSKSLNLK